MCRETDEESEVVPNLMIGFGIDEIQAEYVAEIKLRHLNREYILKRTKDLEDLEKEIAELDEILKSKARIKTIIVKELKSIAEKYGQPRKSIIIYDDVARYEEETVEIPDYPVNLFFTKEGYFKKITPQSLRMSGEQKLKDGDEIIQELEFTNNCDLLFFTDKCQVYKAKADDFAQTKASVLGDYVAAKLGFDEGENAVKMLLQKITRVCCSLLLKTARLQKFRLNPTQQRLTVKSSRAHTPTNLRLSDFSICLRTKRYSSRRHREICSLFTRVHSLSKQPVQHRVLPFSSPKKVTDFSA